MEKRTYNEYMKLAEEKLVELYGGDMIKLAQIQNEVHMVTQTLVNIDLKNNLEDLIKVISETKKEETQKPTEKPTKNTAKK